MFKKEKKTFEFGQCQRWYYRQWNLYCAVRAREKHTGGGDGDEFKIKLLEGNDNDNDNDNDEETVKDEDGNTGKKGGNGGSRYFSSAQLDRFAQSLYYQMFDEVYAPSFLIDSKN